MAYTKTISFSDKAYEAIKFVEGGSGFNISKYISKLLEDNLIELRGETVLEMAEKFSKVIDDCDEEGVIESAAVFCKDLNVKTEDFIKLTRRIKD